MKTLKFVTIFLFIILPAVSFAAGECPLHSSISTASIRDGRLSLQLQYEYSYMETLREGRNSISPDKVLDDRMSDPMVMRYSVPTKMIMQKYSFVANYAPQEKLQLMLTIPYVINDMEMRMAMRDMEGMIMKSDMEMDTVEGLSDITIIGLYNLYSDPQVKPKKTVSIGLGIKMPTGENDVRKTNGELVHASMQPGTGSWDPIFLINAVSSTKPVSFQFNGLYHLTTKGNEGYEFGDVISIDFISRYQVMDSFNLGLGLNFVYSGKDKDHEGKYSKPETSLIDNTENTGITAFYLSPEVWVKFLDRGSLLLRFQKPIYQDVNGIQQVVDWRALASLIWVF